MIFQKTRLCLIAVVPLLLSANVQAGRHHRDCDCGCPSVQYVEKTVSRLCWVTEMKCVTRTQYRPETRQQECTVVRRIPQTRTVTQVQTVMVPEVRSRTEQYTVRKPVWREEQKSYTVMVPHTETRQGTRTVCKMEQVTSTRTVCVDEGHWEEQCCDPCAKPRGLCGKHRAKKVWVANPVQKEVEVTCCKPVSVEESYDYCVTVCEPEQRTCTVRVCDWVEETCARECKYTVCVPQQVERQCQVTTYKCVPETVVRNYCVMVPCRVTVQVPVRRLRRVCTTVQVPVRCRKACTCTATCGC